MPCAPPCLFTYPKTWGGRGRPSPIHVLLESIWAHLHRCCAYDDGTYALARLEYEEALSHYSCNNLTELQAELEAEEHTWNTTTFNTFAHACYMAVRSKVTVTWDPFGADLIRSTPATVLAEALSRHTGAIQLPGHGSREPFSCEHLDEASGILTYRSAGCSLLVHPSSAALEPGRLTVHEIISLNFPAARTLNELKNVLAEPSADPQVPDAGTSIPTRETSPERPLTPQSGLQIDGQWDSDVELALGEPALTEDLELDVGALYAEMDTEGQEWPCREAHGTIGNGLQGVTEIRPPPSTHCEGYDEDLPLEDWDRAELSAQTQMDSANDFDSIVAHAPLHASPLSPPDKSHSMNLSAGKSARGGPRARPIPAVSIPRTAISWSRATLDLRKERLKLAKQALQGTGPPLSTRDRDRLDFLTKAEKAFNTILPKLKLASFTSFDRLPRRRLGPWCNVNAWSHHVPVLQAVSAETRTLVSDWLNSRPHSEKMAAAAAPAPTLRTIDSSLSKRAPPPKADAGTDLQMVVHKISRLHSLADAKRHWLPAHACRCR